MSHLCPDCGMEHEQAVAEVAVVEDEAVPEAAVRIATIEAERDVTLAKIGARAEGSEQAVALVALQARMDGFQEALDRLAPPPPEPEPVPVVVSEPEAAPVEEPAVVAPPLVEADAKPRKRSNPFWP